MKQREFDLLRIHCKETQVRDGKVRCDIDTTSECADDEDVEMLEGTIYQILSDRPGNSVAEAIINGVLRFIIEAVGESAGEELEELADTLNVRHKRKGHFSFLASPAKTKS